MGTWNGHKAQRGKVSLAQSPSRNCVCRGRDAELSLGTGAVSDVRRSERSHIAWWLCVVASLVDGLFLLLLLWVGWVLWGDRGWALHPGFGAIS